MKTSTMRILAVVIMLSAISAVRGQSRASFNFDDSSYVGYVVIDSINPNNCWQIGTPSKGGLFSSALSLPHAIMTDTLLPYPPHDTSSFTVLYIREIPPWGANSLFLLDFYFMMDSDSLSDFGKVEVSPNNGATWINIMTLDVSWGFEWLAPKPVLTGTTSSWTHFSVDLHELPCVNGMTYYYKFRFTFISDSTDTFRPGWMIDNIHFMDWYEGIDNYQAKNSIRLFPNPATNSVTVENIEKGAEISICDLSGRELMKRHASSTSEKIDITGLVKGFYLVRITRDASTQTLKFLKK
jgi:hypothetical protein